MTTYKVLNPDGTPYHGGSGAWSLPTKRADGSWEPGEWREVEGDLVPCENGLHLCEGEHQLLQWLGPTICEAECESEVVRGADKLVVRRTRLVRVIETWNERTSRLFACDCAEHALSHFEREQPDDNRPRQAVETARRFANGEATHEELTAARVAAGDAARDVARRAAAWAAAKAAVCAATTEYAAWVAARDAVWNAAWGIAWAASRAAAWDTTNDTARDAVWNAAWDAERSWQAERLRQYLSGGIA